MYLSMRWYYFSLRLLVLLLPSFLSLYLPFNPPPPPLVQLPFLWVSRGHIDDPHYILLATRSLKHPKRRVYCCFLLKLGMHSICTQLYIGRRMSCSRDAEIIFKASVSRRKEYMYVYALRLTPVTLREMKGILNEN